MRKPSKYKNIRVEYNGIKFASKAECNRYRQLEILELGGEIEKIELQPRFPLHVNGKLVCTYVGDFQYWDKRKHKSVLEDVKGVITDVFRLKRNLFEAVYHREITIVRAK